MTTVLPLIISNIFMTLARYGHLKFLPEGRFPLFTVILISWGVAFFEYLFQVPANRLGYGRFSATQLKVLQEALTLTCSWFSPFSCSVSGLSPTTSSPSGCPSGPWSWPFEGSRGFAKRRTT